MLYLRQGINVVAVNIDDILYLRQNDHDVDLYTVNGKVKVKGKKIKIFESWLGDNFFKCHSYLIINIDKLTAIFKHNVELNHNTIVWMSYSSTLKVKKQITII